MVNANTAQEFDSSVGKLDFEATSLSNDPRSMELLLEELRSIEKVQVERGAENAIVSAQGLRDNVSPNMFDPENGTLEFSVQNNLPDDLQALFDQEIQELKDLGLATDVNDKVVGKFTEALETAGNLQAQNFTTDIEAGQGNGFVR